MSGNTEFDGICPKNASCTKCGYHFGGIEIKAGIIVCPECAHAQNFLLPEIGPPLPRIEARLLTGLVLLCPAVGLVLAAGGMPLQRAAIVSGIMMMVVIPIGVARMMSKWHSEKRLWRDRRDKKNDVT